jgi:hypothetical protein
LYEFFFKGSNWKSCSKIENQIIKVHDFKRKMKREARKDPNLVANEKFQTWWPLEEYNVWR